MPKLWNETIETHRDTVRGAVLDATAGLLAGQGASGVTMSGIAQAAGIGRATLYKYFPDVESIILAWHERQIQAHLNELVDVKGQNAGARQQLEAVLHAYAFLSRSGHDETDAARLHQGAHAGRAHQHLTDFIAEIIAEGADAKIFRVDVAPDVLAAFCLHALGAAAGLASHEAVTRLVGVTLDALQAPGTPASAGRAPVSPER
ncbi:bacterial regulatory s, tetR family protein [Pseudarthrobacter siccitolerans]|uniref:Bacterial regulatory s, tetR family protein n=1 Tax=Pseudarthrobacter siccitolerans TaxID=861266 RepID=A0A024H6Z7_9MICC|nr:TetR/AcrR family transcriptional regulator [Pseudarthrobacter siccitolerans]CCQ47524.1 bacterial regulatory s, tetR family protein [Pseudarthrobacter siccitolerans]